MLLPKNIFNLVSSLLCSVGGFFLGGVYCIFGSVLCFIHLVGCCVFCILDFIGSGILGIIYCGLG